MGVARREFENGNGNGGCVFGACVGCRGPTSSLQVEKTGGRVFREEVSMPRKRSIYRRQSSGGKLDSVKVCAQTGASSAGATERILDWDRDMGPAVGRLQGVSAGVTY